MILLLLLLSIVCCKESSSSSDGESSSSSDGESSSSSDGNDKPPFVYATFDGMEFIAIKAGCFQMGNDKSDKDYDKPAHKVCITKDFYLGKVEVTQAQWEKVMGNNPSEHKGDNLPVENVSWDDINNDFLRKLNKKISGALYRLPTEAEWEYAARAGDDYDYAWYSDTTTTGTQPVAQKDPNPWGLHDMLGNAIEWVQDKYDANYYQNSPTDDPKGPKAGDKYVVRGSVYALESSMTAHMIAHMLATHRFGDITPDTKGNGLGFRLVRELQ